MLKKMKRALLGSVAATVMAIGLTGCGASKDVLYMQNLTPEAVIEKVTSEPVKLQIGDEIMIYVSCNDVEMAARLSQMSGMRAPQITAGEGVQAYSAQVMLPYTVNRNGDIVVPEIGTVHVAGLTRQQVAEVIEKRIVDAKLVKDNSVGVTVQFANLTFTAIGEVNKRGTFEIIKDEINLLEALAMAQDLTIYGRRDAVLVLREQPDGSRKTYSVDLRGTDFMESPAYIIQQNDIIYVQPNSIRAGQSTLNENTFKSVGFWTSLASVAMSIATFAVTLSK